MSTQTQLTDTNALSQRRARATEAGMFLQESAADEIKDRLLLVNRAFTQPAVVTPYPNLWTQRLPDACVVNDDEVLDLDLAAHDLVIHSMSLHWSNDPVGQLIQCRRALKPDGLLMVSTFGGQTLSELRQCLGEAEISLVGGLSPRIVPMAEIRDLGALLQRAGFALPVADSVPLRTEYRDAFHLMLDIRQMGEANALVARHRKPPPKNLFSETNRLYTENFSTENERISATFELVFLAGWAPDSSQQKPLRPGTARHRLADALKVPEVPLRD